MAAFALGFSQRFVQYGVLWTPLLFLLGTAALDEASAIWRDPTARGRPSRPLRWLAQRAAIGLIVLNLAGTAWLAYRFSASNFAVGCQQQATRPWFELRASVGAFCRPVGRLQGAWLGDVGLGFSVVGQSTSVFRCDYP